MEHDWESEYERWCDEQDPVLIERLSPEGLWALYERMTGFPPDWSPSDYEM